MEMDKYKFRNWLKMHSNFKQYIWVRRNLIFEISDGGLVIRRNQILPFREERIKLEYRRQTYMKIHISRVLKSSMKKKWKPKYFHKGVTYIPNHHSFIFSITLKLLYKFCKQSYKFIQIAYKRLAQHCW